VILTHPRDRYTGPVVTAAGRRMWFLDGRAEATNLSAAERRSLEDARFDVVNPRAHYDEDDAGASDAE
jgi:hypothetical protein